MRFGSTALAFAAALTLFAATTAGAAAAKPSGGITPYEAKKWVASVSLGFGDAGYYGSNQSPMIGVSAEYGYNDKISLGGSVGHSSSTYKYDYGFGNSWEWKYGYTIIAARGSYHFGDQLNIENLDAYAGATVGYNYVSVTTPSGAGYSYSAGGSVTRAGLYAGGRYWFSPKFAGFGELGFGLGNLVLGASMRF